MTADEKKHDKRCETCENEGCDLSNQSFERAKKEDILSIGRRMMMRSTTLFYGCASHSTFTDAERELDELKGINKMLEEEVARLSDIEMANERRIADVIEELEKEKTQAYNEITHRFLDQDTYREGEINLANKAISLLKQVKK